MTEIRKNRKKKRKARPVRDWLAYAALRVLLFVLYRFSVNANLRLARFLGRLMWKHYQRGRERALENLRRSFPEKDEQWCIETGRRSFEQIVMMVVDIFFTSRLINRDNCHKFANYKNLEHSKWIMQGGQGLLLLTAHYGNFEIMGYMLGLFGFNLYSIARPLDNKYMNNYLLSLRKHTGQKIIDKKGATDKMDDIIKEHASVGFIADQDAGKKGVFVDFFGKKASTYKSIALLAMHYDMPVAIASAKRVGNKFFFEIEIHRIIFPEEWKDKDDPLTWITQEYVRETENFIRQDPSHYWWLHRRWKHRPKEERRKNV
ncbi:MAG: lysophospholipid acyltransferase family protein [Planctomycetes bacterium]|nr:lysophospholipid acyltransferase family protein [Planctomycetota bacterium]